jgi:thiamine transport system substrate-binding protein
MFRRFLVVVLALFSLVVSSVAAQDDRETLTVITYDSFSLSEDVINAFEDEANVELEFVLLSDAGAMVNQAILRRNNPLGDVIYGVDNTFLSRAIEGDIFISYEADGLENVPEEFQLDQGEFRVTPVTFGDVCLNYDKQYFEENELALPESLMDLTQEAYEDLLVVQNPATSSPGLAFLIATIVEFGEEGDYTYLDYWRELRENGLLIVDGWTEAYYGEFTVASDTGDRPLVVSYASSPPAEVLFAEPQPEEAPSGAIVKDGMCFRQIEFAGILQGTQNLEAAQQFIDFALSTTFQEDLPLQMFVFPVNENAVLPDLFQEYAQIPENPATIEYEMLDENREDWLREWTQEILR